MDYEAIETDSLPELINQLNLYAPHGYVLAAYSCAVKFSPLGVPDGFRHHAIMVKR